MHLLDTGWASTVPPVVTCVKVSDRCFTQKCIIIENILINICISDVCDTYVLLKMRESNDKNFSQKR